MRVPENTTALQSTRIKSHDRIGTMYNSHGEEEKKSSVRKNAADTQRIRQCDEKPIREPSGMDHTYGRGCYYYDYYDCYYARIIMNTL